MFCCNRKKAAIFRFSRLVIQAAIIWMIAGLAGVGYGRAYGPAGCGLGSIVMGPKPGFTQVFAASTNYSSGNPFWGIVSGTSNCVAGPKAVAMIEQENFVSHNLASLAREVPQGGGETTAAFAETLGCNEQVLPKFNSILQSNASTIFAAPGALAVLDVAVEHLKDDTEIAASCNDLI